MESTSIIALGRTFSTSRCFPLIPFTSPGCRFASKILKNIRCEGMYIFKKNDLRAMTKAREKEVPVKSWSPNSIRMCCAKDVNSGGSFRTAWSKCLRWERVSSGRSGRIHRLHSDFLISESGWFFSFSPLQAGKKSLRFLRIGLREKSCKCGFRKHFRMVSVFCVSWRRSTISFNSRISIGSSCFFWEEKHRLSKSRNSRRWRYRRIGCILSFYFCLQWIWYMVPI